MNLLIQSIFISILIRYVPHLPGYFQNIFLYLCMSFALSKFYFWKWSSFPSLEDMRSCLKMVYCWKKLLNMIFKHSYKKRKRSRIKFINSDQEGFINQKPDAVYSVIHSISQTNTWSKTSIHEMSQMHRCE